MKCRKLLVIFVIFLTSEVVAKGGGGRGGGRGSSGRGSSGHSSSSGGRGFWGWLFPSGGSTPPKATYHSSGISHGFSGFSMGLWKSQK